MAAYGPVEGSEHVRKFEWGGRFITGVVMDMPPKIEEESPTKAFRMPLQYPRKQVNGFLNSVKALRKKDGSWWNSSPESNGPREISLPLPLQNPSRDSLDTDVSLPDGRVSTVQRVRMRKVSKDVLRTPFKQERKPGEGYEWTLTQQERERWDDYDTLSRKNAVRFPRPSVEIPRHSIFDKPLPRPMHVSSQEVRAELFAAEQQPRIGDIYGIAANTTQIVAATRKEFGLTSVLEVDDDFLDDSSGTSTPSRDHGPSTPVDPILLEDAFVADSVVHAITTDEPKPVQELTASEIPPPRPTALSVMEQFTAAIAGLSPPEKAAVFRMLKAFVDLTRVHEPLGADGRSINSDAASVRSLANSTVGNYTIDSPDLEEDPGFTVSFEGISG